jgi:hypothetical protein
MQTPITRSGILEEKIPQRCIEDNHRTEQSSVIKLLLYVGLTISFIILSIGTSYRIAHPTTDVSFNLTKK